MRLFEIANAQQQIALWRLISDNVWAAIEQQAREEAERKAEEQRRRSVRPKRATKAKAKSPAPKLPTAPLPKDDEAPAAQRSEVDADTAPSTAAKDDQTEVEADPSGLDPAQDVDASQQQNTAPSTPPLPTAWPPMTRQSGGIQVAQKPPSTTKSPVL
jgi:hypothetical protein